MINHWSTINRPSTMVSYIHLHPERHANGVYTMEIDSQFQFAEYLQNESVYYNVAAIFLKLTITYVKYNITLQYACVITNPTR